jgi:hypothetical protein
LGASPPLTDEQIDAICEIIIAARKRRQHQAGTKDSETKSAR